jgi:uncharacterized protein YdeI (YjbR/CyaY-like superfamily)
VNREPRVDAYIANAQPFARPILEKVRERVHAVVPDIEEAMKWSAPGFTLEGKILLVMAAFKAHAALNFWRGQEIGDASPKAGAMGQFGRLRSLSDLPPDKELDLLIHEAAALAKTAPAPRKTKHVPKPAPEMHPAFEAALRKAPKARVTFEGFPPGCRREYLEWVSEAKRDETRQKRIVTAIEWLSEGKRRNWKYENCS